MDTYWDGQVEQLDRDLAAGVTQADDPMYPGEPDAFPRLLPTPTNPLSPPSEPGQLPAVKLDPVAEELALLRAIRDGTLALAVSNLVTQPLTQDDWPVPGMRRVLIPRDATGNTLAVAEAASTLLPHNPSRIGLSIVNTGAKAVRLFFARLGQVEQGGGVGIGRAWLAPEGGSWDGRISRTVWCGSIVAQSIGGAGQVDVAEL